MPSINRPASEYGTAGHFRILLGVDHDPVQSGARRLVAEPGNEPSCRRAQDPGPTQPALRIGQRRRDSNSHRSGPKTRWGHHTAPGPQRHSRVGKEGLEPPYLLVPNKASNPLLLIPKIRGKRRAEAPTQLPILYRLLLQTRDPTPHGAHRRSGRGHDSERATGVAGPERVSVSAR